MGDVMNNVLDAIEILSNAQIKKSNSSTYLKAQIVSCEDSVLQKYKCKFQDSIFYATTSIPFNKIIPKDTLVWILIPNNDYSQQKKIIGTVESLGHDYISMQSEAEIYDLIGTNTITSNEIYYLDTNNEEYSYILYDCDRINNDIDIDIKSLNEYLLQSSQLLIGAYFKTSIPAKRQNRGHYGITYELIFKDDNTNEEIIKTFTIDEDNMIDNPYRLLYETRQYKIFDIDSQNFIKVKSISIFNKDFPQAEGKTTNRKLSKGDIQISKIELCGAIKNQTYDNGLSISFYTPKGTFFTEKAISGDFKTITAYLKVNGLRITDTEKLAFYWGREDIGISSTSQYYNSHLGRGWKCLNQSNIISGTGSKPTISWVPASDTFQITLQEASAKDNNIKVAIVYNNSVATKTINIRNLGAITDVSIVSDSGVEFYHGVGHPKLTCQVEGNLPNSSYKYFWGVEDNNSNFLLLPQTTAENEIYNNAVDELNQLIYDISTGRKYKEQQEENIKQLEQKIQSYNYIQRVEGNIIHDVQINNITGFSTFKCSVYSNNDVYLGTAAITLQNKTQAEALYTLIINNGTQVFQYNEQGIAPNNASLQNQQKLPILDFTLYDEVGNAIDSDIIKNNDKCSIRWSIPIKDTLLEDSGQNGQSSGFDSTLTFLYYENLTNFSYNIKQLYNIQAANNQIELTINYNGLTVTARTNFTFVKQGQPGTNGSQYVIKIIPNTLSNNIPYFPMIINRNGGYYLNYGLNSTSTETEISTDQGQQLFKAQVWNNGELLWEGFSVNNGIGTTPDLIHWDILSNKYSSLYQDESAFEITNPLTGFIRYTGKFFSPITDRENPYSYANIIQCSVVYNGKTYYGTIPIITAITFDPNYNIKLQDFTGFKYVLYSSSGTTPQYDNTNPFTFVCQQKMNGIWVESKNVQYIPSSIGSIKNNKTGTIIDKSNLLQLVQYNRYDLQNNQWYYQPAINYDGQCVNLAVLCKIKKNGTTMGHIHIPIHFLLNKYGLANINGWDGNSIQINEEGGYILTPQMGSGQKDENNNFTGILMGSVKESSTDNTNNVYQGLLAYNKGERSFFLNAKNGSAIFGKSGGKLTIDPNNQKMMIYSSNFWNQYKDDGLPNSYNIDNEKHEGLLIDLSTPEIRYGNGKFSISSDGILNCTDAHISGSITATDGTIGTEEQGFTITADSLIGYKTGLPSGTELGYDYITTNNLTATGGTIGGWKISEKAIISYLDVNGNTIQDPNQAYTQIYFGNGSIASKALLVVTQKFNTSSKEYPLYIKANGYFRAYDNTKRQGFIFDPESQDALTVYGNLKAGKIGGWIFNENQIYKGDSLLTPEYISASFIEGDEIGCGSLLMQAGDSGEYGISYLYGVPFEAIVGEDALDPIIRYSEGYVYESQVNITGGAGRIYLYSNGTGTGANNRGLYGNNSAGTAHSIIAIGQNNISYFKGQADSVSDLKKKNIIQNYNWKVKQFIKGLKPIAYTRKYDDNSTGDRIHYGFGAQEVRDLAKQLYDIDLGVYTANQISVNDDGQVREISYHGEEIDDSKLSWSLAYAEFIAPIVLELQSLIDEVDNLKEENQILKQKINKLT